MGRPAVSVVSTPTMTCPSVSSITGTGVPNIFGLSWPLTTSIASRRVSASSLRTGARDKSRLSGSTASPSAVRVEDCL